MNKKSLAEKQNLAQTRRQEWWEISRNLNPNQAMAEELNEILEEARWWRKFLFKIRQEYGISNRGYSDGKGYTSPEDIDNFWKKWSDGGHFWHPEKRRWYSLERKKSC